VRVVLHGNVLWLGYILSFAECLVGCFSDMTDSKRDSRSYKARHKRWYNRAYQRFQAKTPKVARRIRNISAFISGVSLAVMTALLSAQATIPDWFYPYLIGLPAAIAFVFQFAEDKDDDKSIKDKER